MTTLLSPHPLSLSPDELVGRIRRGGRALIALSGGVDSSLVAALAREALGPDAVAVTLTGPAVSHEEAERARRVAVAIGIEHHLVPVDPLERAEYRANPSDRCYHCRAIETGALLAFGQERGIRQYLDGIHVDDLGEDRPGLRAMDEAGFTHPLLAGHWSKTDVRAEAQRRDLPNWDQPSDACLASRVAHGDPISHDLLGRIERAEAGIRAEGFRRVRVRVSGPGARIEVDPDEVPRLRTEPLATRVVAEVRALGFEPVTIDPNGYRSGGRASGAPP
jgi:pyridinium-3,5-biscarboxylic acid mononucleotide sulfurtransferase